ncbi:MAG TPA: hypothetical protein VGN51_00435 [Acidimicrobiia bacterium]|jgi:hypothetical protein
MQQAGVITITTRATARPRPTTQPRRTVASGSARVVSRTIYWRRRAVVAVMVVALLFVMARAGVALGESPSIPERHPAHLVSNPSPTTVVEPGDSLWTVAERLAPNDDPRPVVDALSSARHGTVLTPGETISWDG